MFGWRFEGPHRPFLTVRHRILANWMPDQGNGYFDAGINRRFGATLRPFAPCAAEVFGRWVPSSQVACAVWRGNRLRDPCFPIRHPSEASACESMLLLRRRETSGTSELLRPVPSFPRSRQPELYDRFRRGKGNTAASLSASRCHLARVVLIRAILSSDSRSSCDGLPMILYLAAT